MELPCVRIRQHVHLPHELSQRRLLFPRLQQHRVPHAARLQQFREFRNMPRQRRAIEFHQRFRRCARRAAHFGRGALGRMDQGDERHDRRPRFRDVRRRRGASGRRAAGDHRLRGRQAQGRDRQGEPDRLCRERADPLRLPHRRVPGASPRKPDPRLRHLGAHRRRRREGERHQHDLRRRGLLDHHQPRRSGLRPHRGVSCRLEQEEDLLHRRRRQDGQRHVQRRRGRRDGEDAAHHRRARRL